MLCEASEQGPEEAKAVILSEPFCPRAIPSHENFLEEDLCAKFCLIQNVCRVKTDPVPYKCTLPVAQC